MLETYKAMLHGDKIEWETDAPKISRSKKPLAVYVTVVDETGAVNSSNGEKMAEILRNIAAKGGISSIGDAGEWQREQRRERQIAEREE